MFTYYCADDQKKVASRKKNILSALAKYSSDRTPWNELPGPFVKIVYHHLGKEFYATYFESITYVPENYIGYHHGGRGRNYPPTNSL